MVDLGDGMEEEAKNGALELSSTMRRSQRHQAKVLAVAAGARFLFYPTLLYNVIRNKLEPNFRWWDEIDQFLLLGAVPFPGDIPRLKDAGVHAVVTLNEPFETLVPSSLYKGEGMSHLVIPTTDYLFAPSFLDIQRAVAFIHDHAQRGQRTYVHCKAGRGRSTTIVICYLVEHGGMSPLEALCYVRSRRPRVLLAPSQWQAVEDYSKQIQSRCIHRRLLPSIKQQLKDEDSSAVAAGDSDGETVEDSAVLVSTKDLMGYRGIEDAGLVGNSNEYIGLVYRLRLLAARNVAGVGVWSKISCLWIPPKTAARQTPSVCGLEVVVSSPGAVVVN